MDAVATSGVLRYFQDLLDARKGYLVRHKLTHILTIAILAVICRAEDWQSVVRWARCKIKWLETFLYLPKGIPSHDTFARVFSKINPDAFERCFINWMKGVAASSKGRLVAVDGKSIRRSFRHGWDNDYLLKLIAQ